MRAPRSATASAMWEPPSNVITLPLCSTRSGAGIASPLASAATPRVANGARNAESSASRLIAPQPLDGVVDELVIDQAPRRHPLRHEALPDIPVEVVLQQVEV